MQLFFEKKKNQIVKVGHLPIFLATGRGQTTVDPKGDFIFFPTERQPTHGCNTGPWGTFGDFLKNTKVLQLLIRNFFIVHRKTGVSRKFWMRSWTTLVFFKKSPKVKHFTFEPRGLFRLKFDFSNGLSFFRPKNPSGGDPL